MRIMVVTGSRADYSALEMVYAALREAGHDAIWARLWGEVLIGGDTPFHAACDAGTALVRAAQQAVTLAPDLAVLVGDRHEVLAAATACHVMGVPFAHLYGGDRTLGSADDAMRDAITMMASLHFPAHQKANDRLINRLGVDARRVFCVGSPAIDRIVKRQPVSRETAFTPTGIEPSKINVLVAVHPDTSPGSGASDECGEILHACVDFSDKGWVSFFAVSPNSDAGNAIISQRLVLFCASQPRSKFVGNLPPDQFIDLLACCDLMVGNSSSGIYEAPALGVPSIVVGDRQKGRPLTAWAYVPAERGAIKDAMVEGCERGPLHHNRTFGDGTACQQIAEVVGKIVRPRDLLWREL